jgi:predicted transcriptional regulator
LWRFEQGSLARSHLESRTTLFRRIHLLLIDDAKRGLADIVAGRTFEADGVLAKLQQRRTAAAKNARSTKPAKKRG